jgi:hypothetical protein
LRVGTSLATILWKDVELIRRRCLHQHDSRVKESAAQWARALNRWKSGSPPIGLI